MVIGIVIVVIVVFPGIIGVWVMVAMRSIVVITFVLTVVFGFVPLTMMRLSVMGFMPLFVVGFMPFSVMGLMPFSVVWLMPLSMMGFMPFSISTVVGFVHIITSRMAIWIHWVAMVYWIVVCLSPDVVGLLRSFHFLWLLFLLRWFSLLWCFFLWLRFGCRWCRSCFNSCRRRRWWTSNWLFFLWLLLLFLLLRSLAWLYRLLFRCISLASFLNPWVIWVMWFIPFVMTFPIMVTFPVVFTLMPW